MESQVLFDLKITDTKARHRFNFSYDSVHGDYRTAKHDEAHVYLLPYEHGTKQRIAQGYHGKFSHSDPGREFALDFKMSVGTPITAARSGLVIKVKEDSDKGGSSMGYSDDGNVVTILHDDGSFAEYVHLKKDGVMVDLGDSVKAGDKIGLSGKTGRATGPHLHFQVSIPTVIGKVKTVPTRFYDYSEKAVSLTLGKNHYAYHLGKPPFEVVVPKEVTNADKENHKEQVPENNKISNRAETIDGTVILYISNGYPVAKKIEISMPKLDNLVPSKALPLTIVVQPLTERFALFVREKDPGKAFSYRIGWKFENAGD